MKKHPNFSCEQHHASCPGCGQGPRRDPIAEPCVHFAGFTGQDIPAKKGCGCKTAEPVTAAAECELHGLCTVVQPAADAAVPCCESRCDDYEP